jgi:hypothetical protein
MYEEKSDVYERGFVRVLRWRRPDIQVAHPSGGPCVDCDRDGIHYDEPPVAAHNNRPLCAEDAHEALQLLLISGKKRKSFARFFAGETYF